MLIGSIALAALPFTSGFHSKDAIVLASFEHERFGWLFWGGAAFAAFLTALYTTRMMVLTFFGETRSEPHDHSRVNMWGTLAVLCLLAIGGGWFGLEAVATVLPDGGLAEADHGSAVALATMAAPFLGIALGWLLFHDRRVNIDGLIASKVGAATRRFWFSGWGFDWVYDRVFVKPFVVVAHLNKADAVDFAYRVVAAVARGAHYAISLTQSGRLRWYAANMAIVLIVAFLIVLDAW